VVTASASTSFKTALISAQLHCPKPAPVSAAHSAEFNSGAAVWPPLPRAAHSGVLQPSAPVPSASHVASMI
jgi:hypothetical protein